MRRHWVDQREIPRSCFAYADQVAASVDRDPVEELPPDPPRYVEYRIVVPVGSNFVMKVFPTPRTPGCRALTVGITAL